MLNHPDEQVQYIFTTLENQRDNVMIENGNLCVQVKALKAEIDALRQVPIGPKEEAAAEESPIN